MDIAIPEMAVFGQETSFDLSPYFLTNGKWAWRIRIDLSECAEKRTVP
jgi:hypothetical protein